MKRRPRLFVRSSFSPKINTEKVRPRVSLALPEPHLWYPLARRLHRTVTCHIGPTNSGKTHAALQALKAAPTGVYCGPLRLLAWEVSNTLRHSWELPIHAPNPDHKGYHQVHLDDKQSGKVGEEVRQQLRCDLLTGQERDLQPGSRHVSCTVEMCPLDRVFACGVLDEAQLLGDPRRGWAWTQAFLGLQAEEIHMCGSPSFLPLVRELCRRTGDTLQVLEYPRLSPLTITPHSLDTYRNIEQGDCVIAFSKKQLFRIKAEIEHANPALKCGIIYGSLPPDVRRQQASLFNASSDVWIDNMITTPIDRDRERRKIMDRRPFDVLVASDAVGMGLNLTIRRVIFSTLEKFDGIRRRLLFPAEVKQIAGRAGRYGTLHAEGHVTTLHSADKDRLRMCLLQADAPVRGAGVFPSRGQLELLGALLDNKMGGRGKQQQHRLLAAFWKDFFLAEGSFQLQSYISKEDMYRPEFVTEHCHSMRAFSIQLGRFLREHDYHEHNNYDESDEYEDDFHEHINHHNDFFSLNSSMQRFPQTPLSTLLEVFKHSVSFTAPPSAAHNAHETSRDDNAKHDKKKKRKNKKNKKKEMMSDPLQTQRRGQGGDDEGCGEIPLYFVGDLDEKRQVAEVLERVSVSVSAAAAAAATSASVSTVDRYLGRKRGEHRGWERDVSLSLSFRDQYVFCLAPVNVDNPEVIRALTVIAQRYLLSLASSPQTSNRQQRAIELDSDEDIEKVEESEKVVTVVLPEKYFQIKSSKLHSTETLAKLETTHQILELYIWLGYRFPDQFLASDVSKAQQRCQQCSAAIEQALRTPSSSSTQLDPQVF